jgi:hypothetical protein
VTKHRLTRLENIARQQGRKPCPLCKGEPWARVYRVEDWRSGERIAPEWYLPDDCAERLTDDLRCRRCGTRVLDHHLLVLFLLKGAGWPLPNDPPSRTYRAILPVVAPRADGDG